MGADRHVVVARVSASDGSVVVNDVPTVDPGGDGGRIVECDVDRLLTGPEAAELVGLSSAAWRSLVRSGRAPAADGGGRWRVGTVADWNVVRPRGGDR